MTAYLDASAILPILIEEAGSKAVDQFVSATREVLVVSEFAAAEVASAMSRLVRTGMMDMTDATARLADFEAWRQTSTDDLDLCAAERKSATGAAMRCATHGSAHRRARLAIRMSQYKLAELIGTDQTYVSKYESGRRRLDVIEFLRITQALGCDYKEIIDRAIGLGDL